MKKIIALTLAALMLVFCVACGNTNDDVKDTDVTTDEITTEADVVEPAKTAEEVLNAVTGKFYETLAPIFGAPVDDVKGVFVGGYFSDDETTMKSSEAGKTPVDVEDAAASFKTASLISDDAFAKLDDAAVFHHMMNMNTFSASAMRVANAADVEAVAKSMEESVGGNPVWMCGQPERYLVVTVDTCVISVYGLTDYVNSIKTAITETYENAVVVADGAFVIE